MKTIKIKKSTLFVWLSLCLLAAYTVVVKQNRQEIEIQCSTVARVTLPVSILSIENETLRPEQIDISAYIFPNDSIRIYHLYQGCPCSPELRLQGDTLQIRPIQPKKRPGITFVDSEDLHITPNQYIQKILLNGEKIWEVPLSQAR